jgi:hypothetical protein
MAGGIKIISPGSIWRVLVIEPSVAPARRSPNEEIIRATKPSENTDLFRSKKSLVPSNKPFTLNKEPHQGYINFLC